MDGIIRSTTYPKKLKLEELDYFSEGVGITVEDDDRMKSKLGSFISISIYTLLILATYYYLKKFIDTTGPKIQYNVITDSNGADPLNLAKSGTYFFMFIENPEKKSQETYVAEDALYNDLDALEDSSDAAAEETVEDPAAATGARRILQIPTPQNYLLKFEELPRYFNYQLDYIVNEYKKIGASEMVEVVKRTKLDLVKCTDTDWFRNKTLQKILKQSEFALKSITSYGICFRLGDKVSLFGDTMTKTFGFLSLNFTECDSTKSPNCLTDAYEKIVAAKGVKVVLGALEPTLNNSEKKDPFSWSLNIDNSFNLDPLLEVKMGVSIKQIEAITDMGMVIEDQKSIRKGAIGKITYEFGSKFTYGTYLSGDDYYLSKSDSTVYFSINIMASRTIEQFTRTYDTILDLFGNIGGSIDFLIILFTICFHWHENYTTAARMRSAIGKSLNLPVQMRQRNDSVFSMCCKKTPAPMKEALDGMVEQTMSFERMANDAVTSKLVRDYLLPKEVSSLGSIVVMMGRLIEAKKEEAREKSKGRNKESSVANSSHSHQVKDSTGLSIHQNGDGDDQSELSPMKAYEGLVNLNTQNQPHLAALRSHFLNIIQEYQQTFNISSVAECLEVDARTTQYGSDKRSDNIEMNPITNDLSRDVIRGQPPKSKIVSGNNFQ